MSVINQMLKDLEQRAPEPGVVPGVMPVNNKPSTLKVIVISMFVLLIINALGFYIWDLQTRAASSELKAKESVEEGLANQAEQQKPAQLIQATNSSKHISPQQTAVKPTSSAQAEVSQPTTKKLDAIEVETPQQVSESLVEIEKTIEPLHQETRNVFVKVKENVEQTSVQSTKPSKMSVSRRQLTVQELVKQKLTRAEKAVNTNKITTAEKLFEEVLILEPNNKQARRKLAALWFGRKSYQQAVNLLSQGIALHKQDSELRILKARIQLKQGQHKGAYHTLKALPELEQQDYQVMLANVALQIEAYESAIIAYQVLIKMQPYSGKWHLGLAIVYDKNSQFTLAEKEYALALSKHDLSNASAEFATQRMQALGE